MQPISLIGISYNSGILSYNVYYIVYSTKPRRGGTKVEHSGRDPPPRRGGTKVEQKNIFFVDILLSLMVICTHINYNRKVNI